MRVQALGAERALEGTTRSFLPVARWPRTKPLMHTFSCRATHRSDIIGSADLSAVIAELCLRRALGCPVPEFHAQLSVNTINLLDVYARHPRFSRTCTWLSP